MNQELKHFKCTYLVSCIDYYYWKKEKASLLAIATQFGHMKCVVKLVEKYNADINEVCEPYLSYWRLPFGYNPLSIAIITEEIDITRFLLSKGVDVNAPNSSFTPIFDRRRNEIYHEFEGNLITPLMVACNTDNPNIEIIKLLLDGGADVNGKSIQGCTALHICSALGHLDVLKLLIEDYGGQILSHEIIFIAALECQIDVIEYLTNKETPIQISLKDKIDAFDILGATLIQRDYMSRGVECWRKGFEMRSVEGVVTCNKEMKNIDLYDEFQEFVSPEQWKEIKKEIDFSDEFREIITFEQLEEIQNNRLFLQIQSLLIIERIRGPTHKNTFKNFESMNTCRDFGKVIKLWNHNINNILVLLLKKSCILSPKPEIRNLMGKKGFDYNDYYPGFYKYYLELEMYLLHRLKDFRNNSTITIEDVILILKICKKGLLLLEIIDISFDISKEIQGCIMNLIIYCLAYLFIKFKNDLTIHQWQLIKEIVEFYVKKDPRSRFDRRTLLHTACILTHNNWIIRIDDNIRGAILPMVKLILESGPSNNEQNRAVECKQM